MSPLVTTAIQCKYHETQQQFALSDLYKPILIMMDSYHRHSNPKVTYVLYAHFPNESGTHTISHQDIEQILKTKNAELDRYTKSLRGNIDIDGFLKCFSLEFGASFDNLAGLVQRALETNGMPKNEIDTLVYPNAINEIANLSMKHDAQDRSVTKAQFLRTLRTIRRTAISRWTIGVKGKKEILDTRRQQLKLNLAKNARLRCFIIPHDIDDFDDGIVLFISDYLDKYHCKIAHTKTPLFCLDCTSESFERICQRLYEKHIKFEDGFVGHQFHASQMLREPMVQKVSNKINREFDVKLMRLDGSLESINLHKCHEIFCLGPNVPDGVDIRDVNIEHIGVSSLQELKYILGVSNVWE
jgi:hypothetical protein